MSAPFIVVTGSTGQQGGAVLRHLQSAGLPVLASVRYEASAISRLLSGQGVPVVEADFSDTAGLRRAFEGASGVFSMQPSLRDRPETETQWGKNVADAAKAAGVRHLVYSSIIGASEAGKIARFRAKAEVERHIASLGISATILRPAVFMDNLLNPVIRNALWKGTLTTANAVNARQALVAVDDIGATAALVFQHPDRFRGRTMTLVGDVLSAREQAAMLERMLGWKVKPKEVPRLLVRIFLGRDQYQMYRWIDRMSSRVRVDPHDTPKLLSFEQWILAFLPEVHLRRRTA